MVNDKTNINVHRSNGNVVLEKNAQSIVDRKENKFINSKYSSRKDRRKKKQRSSKNKNTRRYSSPAGKKHCGDVCGCK